MNIKISHITTQSGMTYQRCEFETLDDLEEYFVEELLGRTERQSKVIGNVLIWGDNWQPIRERKITWNIS